MKTNTSAIPKLTFAMSAICLLSSVSPGSAQVREQPHNPYDAHAMQLLSEMADSYSHLMNLRQTTTFSSVLVPRNAPPPRAVTPNVSSDPKSGADSASTSDSGQGAEHTLDRRLRLAFAAPNRIRLELEDAADSGKLQVSTWVSDGKFFWTFNPEKNLFSKEKAPAKIQEFARLGHMTSGSLEVLMLMGVNPFARVEESADSVRYVGRETVLGVESDVVAMSADVGPQSTDTWLYIGVTDHLLHRLVSEMSQKPRSTPRLQVGSPLDELAPSDPNHDPPAVGSDVPSAAGGGIMKSRLTCDNGIDLSPTFDAFTFSFKPPDGANYLTNPVGDKPLTLKQRLAEMNRTTRRKTKPSKKLIRF